MIRVRPATHADVSAIQRITAASPTAPQWTEMQFRESIDTPKTEAMRRIVFLVETHEPSETIGFAVVAALVSIYPIEAELESIAVDPAHRGRGAGAALLQAAEDWLTSLQTTAEPAAVFRLEVRMSNLQAIRLYRKHGFLQVAIRPGYYPSPQEDAICMERNIDLTTAPTIHPNGSRQRA